LCRVPSYGKPPLPIDREAARIGVNRQAFIKLRIADSLTAK
jgi:hypothetical protein